MEPVRYSSQGVEWSSPQSWNSHYDLELVIPSKSSNSMQGCWINKIGNVPLTRLPVIQVIQRVGQELVKPRFVLFTEFLLIFHSQRIPKETKITKYKAIVHTITLLSKLAVLILLRKTFWVNFQPYVILFPLVPVVSWISRISKRNLSRAVITHTKKMRFQATKFHSVSSACGAFVPVQLSAFISKWHSECWPMHRTSWIELHFPVGSRRTCTLFVIHFKLPKHTPFWESARQKWEMQIFKQSFHISWIAAKSRIQLSHLLENISSSGYVEASSVAHIGDLPTATHSWAMHLWPVLLVFPWSGESH